jgi:pimeloyl-ACP methyl ester carboxylesterase
VLFTDVRIYRKDVWVSVADAKIPISLSYDTAKGVACSPDVCLVIYGGSRDFSREKLDELTTLLCHDGFAVVSFDFRGTGADSKNFFNTGLHTRIKDARCVFREMILTFPTGRFFILAVSMGGYVATFLDSKDITKLVLVAPAAYDARAVHEKINFGPEFSKLIRSEKSYLASDAFARMKDFRLVPTTIVQFDKDEVIPEEVVSLYFNSHPSTSRKYLRTLPGVHNGNFSNTERMRGFVKILRHDQ